MAIFRRYLYRILRLRNLIALTLTLILLYLLKSLTDADPQPESQAKLVVDIPLSINGDQYFVPKSLKKIDWHDYDQIKRDAEREGIGEQGKPAKVPPEDEHLIEKLYSENGFNGALSDKIPLNRSLPDIRHPGCRSIKYLESLPTVSVVVPFHNEHWSTLLRTAYSAIHRSPNHLIKEVILVDDASTKPFLKDPLDEYLSAHMPRVRVVRLGRRSGLITARLAGAKLATADVLIFLDSHTEANVNWLPPLLEPIALDHRVVVCPFIDVVAYDTLEYRAQDEGARGAFDWEFFYKRLPVLPQDQKNMPMPFKSPVMAGGLFAISRAFFWELGGYDPGLDIWGGEQYELSFKIWQCGGVMVDAPCSRVGHIYRKFAPFPNPGHGDFVGKNYRRVAEVWMDEYAEFLYQRRPHYRDIDPGDLTVQKALRKRLHCKPFKWFMTQVAFDLVGKYPRIEPKPFGEGRIRPSKAPQLCVDARNGHEKEALLLNKCDNASSGEQAFKLSWHKDIRSSKRNMCWDLPERAPGSHILLYNCHLGGGNQQWRYLTDTKQLQHASGACLDYDPGTLSLHCKPCDESVETQQWDVDTVNMDVMRTWDVVGVRVTGPVEPWVD